MTIREAIDEVTNIRPAAYDDSFMVKWLSRCEAYLDQEIVRRYQGACKPFHGFPSDVDENTKLLAWEPHDSLYVHWLEAQIHYANGDIDKYNNAITMFNTEVESFRREYARRHKPLRRVRFRF